MARPQKIKNKNGSISYRIFISNNGKRESKTFSTRQLAVDWVDKRLREIERAKVYEEKSSVILTDVITDYQNQFAKSYGRTKNYDIEKLKNFTQFPSYPSTSFRQITLSRTVLNATKRLSHRQCKTTLSGYVLSHAR